MTSQAHLPIGTRLGNYQIIGSIGEGGMGVVYAAEHVELGKRVAIKTLRDDLAADAGVRARFLREGRAAAAVRHPNVVDVHDVGVHEQTPYLVMELLQGHDLAAHVHREGRLPVQQVADLMAPVLTAMAEAHRAGVVHRDLKPENIFLARGPGGTLVPKVLDFGISKLREAQSMGLTGNNTLLGTPYYMSPEQASSARDVDARADLYSLGVILYHCVSGRVPFNGTSLVQVIGQILHAAPPPIAETVPDIQPAFEQLIVRAMAKDPAARFQTAEELGRALLPFAGPRVQSRYEQELTPVGGVGFSMPQGTPPPNAKTSTLDPLAHSVVGASPKPRSPLRAMVIGVGVLAIIALVLVGLRLRRQQPDGEVVGPPTSPNVIVPTAPAPQVAPSPAAAAPAVPEPAAPAPAAPAAPVAANNEAGSAAPAPQEAVTGTTGTKSPKRPQGATKRPDSEPAAEPAPQKPPAAASHDPFSDRK